MWYYVIKLVIAIILLTIGVLFIVKPEKVAERNRKKTYEYIQKVKKNGVFILICGIINLLLFIVDLTL